MDKAHTRILDILENTTESTSIVFIARDDNQNVLLGTSGNYLVKKEEALKLIAVCKEYINTIDSETVAKYNADLLATRKEATYNFSKTVKKQPKPTYIYLMINRRNNLYKIGRSDNPKIREKTLQSEEPEIEMLHFFPGSSIKEASLHSRYADKRVRGEWFQLEPHEVLFITSMTGI